MPPQPFHFYTHVHLTELTGIKIHNLPELAETLKTISDASIYHHTHRFLQQHQFISPEPPNDFAYWTANVLQEERLGEQLAAVDIISFTSLRELRDELLRITQEYLQSSKNIRTAPAGDELHIMKTKTFILPTHFTANTLEEFLECLKKISINSLYFHMFDARLRLEKASNDFSLWLEHEMGEPEIAQTISRLDPYTQTLEGLRSRICTMIEQHSTTKGTAAHGSA